MMIFMAAIEWKAFILEKDTHAVAYLALLFFYVNISTTQGSANSYEKNVLLCQKAQSSRRVQFGATYMPACCL